MRRFSVVVLGENREAIGLFNSFGDVRRRQYAAGVVELVIELPPKRGISARGARIGEVDAEATESSSGRSGQERSL